MTCPVICDRPQHFEPNGVLGSKSETQVSAVLIYLCFRNGFLEVKIKMALMKTMKMTKIHITPKMKLTALIR